MVIVEMSIRLIGECVVVGSGDDMKTKRFLACLFMIGVGIIFILYLHDYKIRGAPASILGYIAVVFGILGLFGVNVFLGGPLDKRLDGDDGRG